MDRTTVLVISSIAATVLLAAVSLAIAPAGAAPAARQPAHTFGWQDEHFLLDGRPFVIRSGEMHYPRVPRASWHDRLRKMKAMGLNTVCTYVFWDLHEPKPSKFDFSGNLDVAAFVRAAQEEGLWVIIRPGPYICTEWDWGGLPAWLATEREMKVRSANPHFLAAAQAYTTALGRELAPLQITHGGPIIMCQVENEYGSFGNDKTYLGAVRDMIRSAGIDVTLYTSDGPGDRMLAGGTLPDCLSVINFGAGSQPPVQEFATFAHFRQHVPRMCGEYWIGWFDHWGEQHHTTSPDDAARGVDWMLSQGISFNLYMAHGGTSFGYMSGANYGGAYEPDTSAYDYDAPLDEAGRPTAKFYAIRDAVRKRLAPGETLPDLPPALATTEIPRFDLNECAPLLTAVDRLSAPVASDRPRTMELLGQSYGLVLYRKRLDAPAHGTLDLGDVRDYAVVCADGKPLGTLDRRHKQHALEVSLAAGQTLDVLVENMGRINFGRQLVDEWKGLAEAVTIAGQDLTRWSIYPLPLDNLGSLRFSRGAAEGPAFYRGHFDLAAVGEEGAFLDMRGWGKGLVWINGHNVGRYWRIGPQQTLFVPAAWLRRGRNEAIVLDLEPGPSRTLQGTSDPVYETHS